MARNNVAPEDKARARELYKAGASTQDLAAKYGVNRSTVYDWLRDANIPIRPASDWRTQEIVTSERAVIERDERLRAFGHEYNDPNVRFFGDPPFHRSALAQKQKEQPHV